MPDLIDREKVLKYLDDYLASGLFGDGVRTGYEMARGLVECFEPADTERQAHWIKRSDIDYDDGGLGTAYFICSNCNEDKEFYTDDGVEFCLDNFCSNCGCKMNKANNV